MRVLVACECSGIVRDAFSSRGHDALSCDLKASELPGQHYQGNVFDLFRAGEKFDLMIAHPPCTYLSKVGAQYLFKGGVVESVRFNQGLEAKRFFLELLAVDVPRIAIENPTPLKIFDLPAPSDVVQPYYFGDAFKKRTCLWLKGLPPLINTIECVNPESTLTSCWYNSGGKQRQTRRARFWSGMAAAMACQWGS
jgi:hypothetical protein